MSIGGLLGAISGGYSAIQAGIDADQARRDAEEERRYQREQRENARTDRAFGLSQRERLLGEQRRADGLRERLSNIPTTRQIDTRPLAIRGIKRDDTTGPDDGSPSAAQIPVMRETPGPRPQWEIAKDKANAFRQAGEIEKADAYDQVATKAQFAEGARRVGQLQAGAGSMSLEQMAAQAADIFNNDPLPGKVLEIKPGQGGGLSISIANEETGQQQVLEVKDKNELLDRLMAYYSPETFRAAMEARAASQRKIEEEQSKPQKLAPGEVVAVPKTGQILARNTTPTAAQVRAAAGGAGAGRKPEDPAKAVRDALKFVIDSSPFKDQATPGQAATAQRLAQQFYKESVDPRAPNDGPRLPPEVAAEAALDAAMNPDKLKLRFDPAIGQVVMAYPFQGGYMIAERLGSTKSPRGVKPEQMRQVAADTLSLQPEEMRPVYLAAAAAGPKAGDVFRAEVVRRLATPQGAQRLQELYGPNPTQAQINEAVDAAVKEATPALDLLTNHLDPKLLQRERERANPAPERGRVGGLFGRSQPTAPPPDSPSGRFQARQTQLREEAAAADNARAARQAALSAQFRADAKTMDPLALAQKYDSLRFSLPTQDAAELQRIERQIR